MTGSTIGLLVGVAVAIAACKNEQAKPLPAPPAPVPAAAAPALEVSDVTGKPLPAEVKVRGAKIERAAMFVDNNGTNYIVFSSTSKEETSPGTTGTSRSRTLFIDHWAVPPQGKARELLPARDFQNDCVMGALTAAFVPGAFGVTDLDHDGMAEVTYGYQLACRSDVSSATYKLLLVDNGQKFILRGKSRITLDGSASGGELTPEPEAAAWPAGFYEHAVALWQRTDDDLGPDTSP